MYVPEHFKPADEDVRELLRHHGAVDLVTATPDGLRSTMLPMIYVEPGADAGEHAPLGVLRGHFALKNDHWKQAVVGEAMAILRGTDGYITPTWYAAKREHGRVVPTWNYITAHVYGQLVIHEDAAWLERNVRALATKHETGRNPSWSVDDAPSEFISGQLRAIVGVELVITRIDAKFKLSQNRSADDIEGVIAGLEEEGRSPMAHAVSSAAAARKTDTKG
jgi:transcriptional regulator